MVVRITVRKNQKSSYSLKWMWEQSLREHLNLIRKRSISYWWDTIHRTYSSQKRQTWSNHSNKTTQRLLPSLALVRLGRAETSTWWKLTVCSLYQSIFKKAENSKKTSKWRRVSHRNQNQFKKKHRMRIYKCTLKRILTSTSHLKRMLLFKRNRESEWNQFRDLRQFHRVIQSQIQQVILSQIRIKLVM